MREKREREKGKALVGRERGKESYMEGPHELFRELNGGSEVPASWGTLSRVS
mgnify:CR=1 FL=1